MSTSLLDTSVYHAFSASYNGALYNLSIGLSGDYPGQNPSPGPLFFNTDVGYSSNNWQFFYQNSVFLIRNYDYKAKYQLGVNATSSSTLPMLLPASGQLTQQWNITKLNDGTFVMTNMALGSSLALGIKVTSNAPSALVMTDTQNANHWSLWPNVGTDVSSDDLQSVLLQAPSSSSTSLSSASATSSPSTASSTLSTTASGSSSSNSATSQSISSKGISGGAIGGIIAAVVVIALIALGLLFIMRRRKRRTNQVARGAMFEKDANAEHEVRNQHPRHELDVSNGGKQSFSRANELPG